ncbi:MAG: endoglucanase [Gordonia sp.]|uniref:glycoside hydrolase family 26 protein n=1 Tax=Gordonia sp. (in: high G+C Gram-positive bacteria) TaxID=84139 RepID=UPI000C39FD7E|nr:glycosyl hydrolase [Gordonia sp. (in: high G+C Gram-positive bacteria)]MAU81475.1 endoglucanase [Gordonia sp. (in: high G+C Gram-positive bacteria)]
MTTAPTDRTLTRGWSRREVLRTLLLAGSATLPLAACSSPTAGNEPTPDRRWGAYIPSVLPASASSPSPIDQLAALAGAAPGYLHRFAAIGDNAPIADLDAIVEAGAGPLLSLEPWQPDGGIEQPRYALSRIASGDFDDDFRRWATQLVDWGKPILLRFAQEMNGTWYPWAIGIGGNTAAGYRAAWNRMWRIFDDVGADNVRFVWAPNALTAATTDFADAYPGHGVVDYLAVDGYNWGEAPGHHWQSARDLFPPSLSRLREVGGNQPLLITEVGCADGPSPEAKADWIADFFTIVDAEPRLEALLWFQTDKERDWRFNTTPASTAAFRQGLATIVDR